MKISREFDRSTMEDTMEDTMEVQWRQEKIKSRTTRQGANQAEG